MRRLVIVLLCLSFLGLAACPEEKQKEAANDTVDALQTAGATPGFPFAPVLATLGAVGAIVLKTVEWRRAAAGAAYARRPWAEETPEEMASLVARLRALGYKIEGPAA